MNLKNMYLNVKIRDKRIEDTDLYRFKAQPFPKTFILLDHKYCRNQLKHFTDSIIINDVNIMRIIIYIITTFIPLSMYTNTGLYTFRNFISATVIMHHRHQYGPIYDDGYY
jgi:hypothetical protein